MKRFNAITAISAASFLLTAPLAAQEGAQPMIAPPAKTNDQVPGLQQTPDGQTLKTVGEKTRPLQETQNGPATGGGTSTGPTFPHQPPAK
jgi:hypothetical protein